MGKRGRRLSQSGVIRSVTQIISYYQHNFIVLISIKLFLDTDNAIVV